MTLYDYFGPALDSEHPHQGSEIDSLSFLICCQFLFSIDRCEEDDFLKILCINTKNAFGTALESSPRLFIFKQHCSTSEIIPQHSQKLGLYFLNVNYNQDSSAHLKKKCCDNIILQKTYFKISWQHISVSVNVLRAFSKRLFDTEGIYDKCKIQREIAEFVGCFRIFSKITILLHSV